MAARFFAWLVLAGALALPAASATAQTPENRPLAVVELFTSQGCNSCPPADELLGRLAERGDVVALAYHVDYWDYLGWRDTLGSPENTERQKAYGRTFASRSIYTPQIVIDGRKQVSGGKLYALEDALARRDREGSSLKVTMSARYTSDSVVISAGAGEGGKAHVTMVFFDPATRVRIDRGRNEGRAMVYRNAVTATQSVGMWHGRAAEFELPISELARKNAGGCAILLQEYAKDGTPGAILGATILEMPSS